MKNAIITNDHIVPFDKIKYVERAGEYYYMIYDGGGFNITEEQRQDYIIWLENKDNTPISVEKNKINEFHKNRSIHVSEIDLDDYDSSYKGQTIEEDNISVIDFIKHMIDNYEVKIEITKDRVENLHLKIECEKTGTFTSIILNGYTEIFKGDTERTKSLMNNEDGYFKERK